MNLRRRTSGIDRRVSWSSLKLPKEKLHTRLDTMFEAPGCGQSTPSQFETPKPLKSFFFFFGSNKSRYDLLTESFRNAKRLEKCHRERAKIFSNLKGTYESQRIVFGKLEKASRNRQSPKISLILEKKRDTEIVCISSVYHTLLCHLR